MKAVTAGVQIIIMSEGGKVIRAGADEIRETGRSAQGVRALTVDEGDRIAGIVVLREREDDADADAEVDNVTPFPG